MPKLGNTLIFSFERDFSPMRSHKVNFFRPQRASSRLIYFGTRYLPEFEIFCGLLIFFKQRTLVADNYKRASTREFRQHLSQVSWRRFPILLKEAHVSGKLIGWCSAKLWVRYYMDAYLWKTLQSSFFRSSSTKGLSETFIWIFKVSFVKIPSLTLINFKGTVDSNSSLYFCIPDLGLGIGRCTWLVLPADAGVGGCYLQTDLQWQPEFPFDQVVLKETFHIFFANAS